MTKVLIVISVVLFFAACAFGLARLSRHVIPGANRTLRILVSALLLPAVLFIAGFVAFVEIDPADWVVSRPLWAWVNLASILLGSILAARHAVRRELQNSKPPY